MEPHGRRGDYREKILTPAISWCFTTGVLYRVQLSLPFPWLVSEARCATDAHGTWHAIANSRPHRGLSRDSPLPADPDALAATPGLRHG